MKIKVFKLEEIKDINGNILKVANLPIQPILPTYAKLGDACMDIYPIYYEYDSKTDNHIYHTGLAFAIDNYKSETYIDGCKHKLEYNIPNEMELRPRSSLTKTSFYMPNSPGTLDWGYRGELMIKLKNRTDTDVFIILEELYNVVTTIINTLSIDKSNNDEESNKTKTSLYVCKTAMNNIRLNMLPPYKCNGKDRCCQLLVRGADRIEWDEVDSIGKLGTTDRGDGGFGHTDKIK